MTDIEERNLVERAKSGDRDAFLELFEGARGHVTAAASRMLRNPEDVKEVVNETFLRALNGISDFRGQSAFSTWIHQITVNAAIDKLRKSPANQTSLSELPGYEEGVAARRENPDAGSTRRGPEVDNSHYYKARENEDAARENAAYICDRALEELTPRYRQIIELRLQETPLKEISAMLRVSMSVIYTANKDFARLCRRIKEEQRLSILARGSP